MPRQGADIHTNLVEGIGGVVGTEHLGRKPRHKILGTPERDVRKCLQPQETRLHTRRMRPRTARIHTLTRGIRARTEEGDACERMQRRCAHAMRKIREWDANRRSPSGTCSARRCRFCRKPSPHSVCQYRTLRIVLPLLSLRASA
eukprot:2586528-Rhodomonas_salina.3